MRKNYQNIQTCPSINPDDYEITQQIRRVTFGCLRMAREKRTGSKVVMKFISNPEKDVLNSFYRSFNACTLDFPGIHKLIGYSFPKTNDPSDSFIIVTEYMENGTLEIFNYRHKHSTKNNPTIRSKIIFGISAIMKKVHESNIIHRNLEPDHIYLDSNFEPQIGNFSLSTFVDDTHDIRPEMGAPIYISPEALKNEEYGTSTDVYSYAIILYRMFTNDFLFENGQDAKRFANQYMHIGYSVIQGICYVKPANIPEHYWELIQRCWAPNSDDRPTFEEITEILKDDKYALREEGEVNMDELHEYQQRIDSCNINEGDLSTIKTFIQV